MATAKTRLFPPTAAPWFTRTGKGAILPSKSSHRTAGDNGPSFPVSGTPVHPPGHPDGSLEGAYAPGFIHQKEGNRNEGYIFLEMGRAGDVRCGPCGGRMRQEADGEVRRRPGRSGS